MATLPGNIDRLEYGDIEKLIEDALKNLDMCFLWAGLTERYDESILVLAYLLSWTTVP